MIRNVLSIAGSDPSGGAGIQADLKSFSARGVYGMAAITALTAQNTQGVSAFVPVEADFLAEQIRMIFADVRVDAVKIGMIATAANAIAVAEVLRAHTRVPIILDPVMVAKGGASLLDADAVDAVRQHLLPLATVITPNLPEAAVLLRMEEASDRATMADQARRLMALGPQAVLLKGGHLGGDESPDVLLGPSGTEWFEGPRVETESTHGTGCSLSSAITAELAKGLSPRTAVRVAKDWLTGAIEEAETLSVGSGHGPVHHFHHLWKGGF
ncbi:bifunctional hydroxymethylpyrimidine kinase/phosphomethylpyrimidine kinase [Ciceribacter sp. L1K23]|uniref:bifunctional hydroxymethylpyrimidine kinase/phosphomethylpyrimidine kinase n=1 Tax=Ciceribacter sp. L1K23 TaxID=2820276 RepID=UPI001B817F79|nr:bifunctional hydroxymethylpyrimidine kinase/phosphomethylpyrimidine kinase [Ciceribacter sp. L1K23]MBR0557287.1 bifunctional hydroxymethylpyrimidine kinase/phosphomethylpyrimidine kinase [Ciceribacter sp. L1K23]